MPWRREWQPTPGFLPGEFHRQRKLLGYSPWGGRVGHNVVTEQQQLWVIIQDYTIHFVAQIVPALSIGSSCSLPLCPLNIPSCFASWIFLLSLALYDAWCSFCIFPSQPYNLPFLQEILFLLWENDIRNQSPGTGCAHCFQAHSVDRVWKYKCIY